MEAGPRFSPGDLVAHQRYGYRGVVAGCDAECRASEEWYWGNASQPDRGQPWYHVLVHGGRHTTYVAQENLGPYDGGEQVVHPLTRKLFASFSQARYQVREGVTFPGPTS